jgi:SWI/SNF-related matrix-associated actin-dependent regulator 1 of chromatin subfamily A
MSELAEKLSKQKWSGSPVLIRPGEIEAPKLKEAVYGWQCQPSEDLRDLIASGESARDELRGLRVFAFILVSGERSLVSIDNPNGLQKVAKTMGISRSASSDINVPSPPGMRYLPFQLAGLEYARHHKNVLFADEMGLGKTVEAIGVCNDDPAISDVLVICPAYLKLNWSREILAWSTKTPKIIVVKAGEKVAIGPAGGARFIIINYEILGRYPEILSHRFDCLIIDEAHFIKNMDAKRTAHTLSLEATRKLALTGTPALNRPFELYPIIKMMMGRKAPTIPVFGSDFCGGKAQQYKGCTNPLKLQQYLRTNFMVRRLKAQVLTELPPKQRQVIELPPTKDIQVTLDVERGIWAVHEDTISDLRMRRDEAEIVGDDETFQAVGSSLSKAVSIAFHDLAKVRVQLSQLKVPMVSAHVNDASHGNDNKFIVFFHHKAACRALASELAHLRPLVIDGDVPMDERDRRVSSFQTLPEHRVICGTIGAMGTGVTLTASSTVVMAELDWRPGILAQAEDRAHRIGQKSSVLCQYFLFEDSVDSKIIGDVITKMENLGKVLDGTGAGSATDQKITRTRKPAVDWEADVKTMTPEITRATQQCLQIIGGSDKDRARVQNNAGFSRWDSGIGHKLADKDQLSPREAAFAKHLMKKYHRQLPVELVQFLWPDK